MSVFMIFLIAAFLEVGVRGLGADMFRGYRLLHLALTPLQKYTYKKWKRCGRGPSSTSCRYIFWFTTISRGVSVRLQAALSAKRLLYEVFGERWRVANYRRLPIE